MALNVDGAVRAPYIVSILEAYSGRLLCRRYASAYIQEIHNYILFHVRSPSSFDCSLRTFVCVFVARTLCIPGE